MWKQTRSPRARPLQRVPSGSRSPPGGSRHSHSQHGGPASRRGWRGAPHRGGSQQCGAALPISEATWPCRVGPWEQLLPRWGEAWARVWGLGPWVTCQVCPGNGRQGPAMHGARSSARIHWSHGTRLVAECPGSAPVPMRLVTPKLWGPGQQAARWVGTLCCCPGQEAPWQTSDLASSAGRWGWTGRLRGDQRRAVPCFYAVPERDPPLGAASFHRGRQGWASWLVGHSAGHSP